VPQGVLSHFSYTQTKLSLHIILLAAVQSSFVRQSMQIPLMQVAVPSQAPVHVGRSTQKLAWHIFVDAQSLLSAQLCLELFDPHADRNTATQAIATKPTIASLLIMSFPPV
jgi:hypothetical protein